MSLLQKQFYVYLMASKYKGTLYVGMTNNLVQRVWQHKEYIHKGFTHKFNVTKLVWFEIHHSAEAAIIREKQIKKWNRAWKIKMLERENPNWCDLYLEITM